MLGRWVVHGGSLVVGQTTALANYQGVCKRNCTTWVTYDVSTDGHPFYRLTITGFTSVGDDGLSIESYDPAQRSPEDPVIGNYYVVQPIETGELLTELHTPDGQEVESSFQGANGLGNPYMCRSEGRTDRCGA